MKGSPLCEITGVTTTASARRLLEEQQARREPRLRVLVVEYDAVDRISVCRALSTKPVDVVEAASATDVYRLLVESSFDCVLLDSFLPDAQATRLVPEIRRLAPSAAIVALTSLGDETIAVELMKAGVQDYLNTQGLDADVLYAAIRNAVTAVRAVVAKAEVAAMQRRHAQRLEQLVAHAHVLVEAVGVEELAERAVATAAKVLGATSAAALIVGLDGQPHHAHYGPPLSSTPHCFSDGLSGIARVGNGLGQRPLRALDGDSHLFFMWLSEPSDERARSVLTARVPQTDASELALVEALFTQLGTLLARSIENDRLLHTVERAVRARDDVIAVVSHDLRGPLSNSLLACTLLSETVRDEDKPVVSRMAHSLQHMERLVDDLLVVMKAHRGDVMLEPVPVEPAELLAQAEELVVDAAAKAGVTVSSSSSASSLLADPHRVLQVLANLLSNAVKFTPRGGSVELSASDEGGDVVVRVVDTGSGIPREQQSRIFDRFYSADRTGRGLGLGLAIAKGVVRAHGGRIGVVSAPGQGSTFFFTLPRGGPTVRRPNHNDIVRTPSGPFALQHPRHAPPGR
ncbi:MAG: hybrid sensor histidine kinase/response regulator [Deltaproteobacteria bacterium]|nr:hybrid sensor histidine kinase/response regulator [Deltaproteobacteria bacterium]